MGTRRMTKESLVAWQRGHQVASERSWALRAAVPLSSEAAFDRANSLLRLMADVVTSPLNEEARRKETQVARERWIALKNQFAARSR